MTLSLESQLVTLAAMGRKLMEHGLVRGAGGNVSVRWQDLCYISPTGARLDRLSAGDFVPLHLDRTNTWQLQRASRESAMHQACLQARPDANVVIHVHPPNCLALGCAGLSLKAITPDFYLAVGAEVPLLSYLPPATQKLGDAVGELIAANDAVLLGNHGLVLVASDAETALAHCLLVEEAARIVLLAYAATGACSFLTPLDIEELERITGSYRRQPAAHDRSKS